MLISIPEDILAALSSGYKAIIDDYGDVLIMDDEETAGFCITRDSIKSGKYQMCLKNSIKMLEATVERGNSKVN